MARKKADNRSGKSLVIVESPAKAKTINKYLGKDYVVKASMGHVRDLPKNSFGIDLSDEFKPQYEIVRGRAKIINELKKLAAKAPEVYLATDRDREGEAIAWHLVEALGVPDEKVRRVIFNEITKKAIASAFENPHHIDLDRVNAQQARRILDRIVGYELSPLLWRKIAKGLSAGRVQSVAVRLIVDREREIRNFVPQESWRISALLAADGDTDQLEQAWQKLLAGEPTQKDMQSWLNEHAAFRVELSEVAGAKFEAKTVEDACKVLEALGFVIEKVERQPWEDYKHLGLEQIRVVGRLTDHAACRLRVSDLVSKRTTTKPPAPFTTATLQQAASNALRFSASRTMRVAQALYEGIDLNGEGPVGLITYMRTDSTNLAAEAVEAVRGLIAERFGEQYVPARPQVYAKRGRAQEAHEAIRPTDPRRTPESIRKALTADQFKLYELIWKRFVACQMAPAKWDATSVKLTRSTSLGDVVFSGSGRKLVFDGFMRLTGVSSNDQILPPIEVGAELDPFWLEAKQHYTSPPPRYTEASLVKALEAEGIGRPSTYATIIDTIQQRGYVEQVDRKFHPTPLGEIVTDKLVQHFPKIMDVKFTSHMEDELDKIEEAHLDWRRVLHEFYDPFRELLEKASQQMEESRSQPSDYQCPQCQAPMVYRWGKSGRFLSCSRYPECTGTLNVDRDGKPIQCDVEQTCDQCGKPMTLRRSRTGMFLGCTGYPDCRNTIPCDDEGRPLRVVEPQELSRPCDACGEGTLVVKFKGRRAFLGCDRYPKCKNTASIPDGFAVKRPPAPPPEDAGVTCDRCGKPMTIRKGSRGTFIACSGFPRCRNTKPIEKLEELRAAQPAAPPKPTTDPEASDAETSTPKRATRKRSATAAKLAELGPPPPGFAWTRTGRPVVEELPAGNEKLICPECGGVMELKRGRFGPFFSCGNFPRCRFVANLRGQAKKDAEEQMPAPKRPKPIPTDITCEECGGKMVVRQGQRGRFLGCGNYPKCKHTRELPPGFEIPSEPDAEPIKAE